MHMVSKATCESLLKQKKVQVLRSDSTLQAKYQVVELAKNTAEYDSCPEGKPLQITVPLEGHLFVMKVDTSVSVSLINKNKYE